MTVKAENPGGVDRSHSLSLGPKLAFAAMHFVVVLICLWLAFGGMGWPDPTRAQVLVLCALLYFLRHLVTLFVLLQRKVAMSEVWRLVGFMAIFEIGFLYLGAGGLSGEATPLRPVDWLGAALVLAGSYLNTGSELQRQRWKRHPSSKGHCYTGGLFAYATHINYFGDAVLFTGWAILAVSFLAFSIPLLMSVMFVFLHIPALDAHLSKRYGAEFDGYAKRTAWFIPFLY
ncbi:MAG: DUF1295 domain-containing protein [Cognatishimia sp.]